MKIPMYLHLLVIMNFIIGIELYAAIHLCVISMCICVFCVHICGKSPFQRYIKRCVFKKDPHSIHSNQTSHFCIFPACTKCILCAYAWKIRSWRLFKIHLHDGYKIRSGITDIWMSIYKKSFFLRTHTLCPVHLY